MSRDQVRELWRQTTQPREGQGLVGWLVQTTGVLRGREHPSDELSSGRIVSFEPPDTYAVTWCDSSTSYFGCACGRTDSALPQRLSHCARGRLMIDD
jgi:hypothetical protein